MSTLRGKEENINRQSAMKSVIEYCKLIGKTDLTVKELFRMTYFFSENCLYDNDNDKDFKTMIKNLDEWLKKSGKQ